MPGGYELYVLVKREGGQSAGYIQEEWSRGCRPRATTDFPVTLYTLFHLFYFSNTLYLLYT
jgi:hypothetical protein